MTDTNYLVGFRGTVWSGGAFPSSAATARDAAIEIFASKGDAFIAGKADVHTICVTALKESPTFHAFKVVDL